MPVTMWTTGCPSFSPETAFLDTEDSNGVSMSAAPGSTVYAGRKRPSSIQRIQTLKAVRSTSPVRSFRPAGNGLPRYRGFKLLRGGTHLRIGDDDLPETAFLA